MHSSEKLVSVWSLYWDLNERTLGRQAGSRRDSPSGTQGARTESAEGDNGDLRLEITELQAGWGQIRCSLQDQEK